MGIFESKVASRTEERALGLGLLSSPSSSSAPTPADAPAPLESLTVQFGSLDLAEKPEAKSEGNGAAGEDTGWGGTGWNIEPSGWGDEDDQFEKNLAVPPPPEGLKSEMLHYPQRPGQPDCVFYRTPGGCRFGMNCKFNHSPKKKRNMGRSKKVTEGAELEGKVGTCEVNVVPNEESGLPSSSCSASSASAAEASVAEFNNIMLEEKLDIKPDQNNNHHYPRTRETSNHKKGSTFSKEGKDNGFCFPVRPDKPDCSHYLRTGNCQFGSNCRFNHPPKKKASKGKEKKTTPEKLRRTDNKNAVKERENQAHSVKVEQKDHKAFKERKETPSSKVGKTEHKATERKLALLEKEKSEFKDNSMQVGSTSAEALEHACFQEKVEQCPVQLNFLGLPMRPGERECPHYMRTAGCKFASNCRYHHPDPTAVVGHDPQSGYHPGGSEQASGGSALCMTPWPFPINSREPDPYFSMGPSYTPGLFNLPHQGFYQNPDWNGYQVPITPWFSPEMNIINAPVSAVNVADVTLHQQANSDEYPERPGQPECHFFMKNGECKFKAACRYHHPKSRLQQCA